MAEASSACERPASFYYSTYHVRKNMEQVVRKALANPVLAIECLNAVKAQEHLIDFVRFIWPVLEPGRSFLSGQVVEVMMEHLEAVFKGKIKRLLINVPPGTMKSLGTNVFFPSWAWLHSPDMRFISWSYAEQLTLRDNRKARLLLQSDVYRKFWSDRFQITSDQNTKGLFENNHTGFKMAAGIHGQGTGHRGDCLVIDDPHHVGEAESETIREATLHFFTEVLPTRVNDSKSSIIVIKQRVHENDVSGHIIKHLYDDWSHLCLPMEYESDHPFPSRTALGFTDWRTKEGELLWPERFDREQVEELKKVLRSWGGDYAVSGQLQQRPVPRGGGMFKKDWLPVVDSVPEAGIQCRGWDLAATKDGHGAFTVGLKMVRHYQHGYFITDVKRGRWSPGEAEQKIIATAEADGKACWQSLPQDPGQAGKSQKRYLANLLSGYRVHFSPESGSKEDRARPWAAQAEAGNVHLVRGPWNEELICELTVFPNSTFKDQADAGSRAFAYLTSKRPKNPGAAPRPV